MRYWGYRIDKRNTGFFREELEHGRLRQGWGWLPEHDLRKEPTDRAVARNLRMYREVKQGDILLVPGLPERNEVAVVEATRDWKDGYEFEIDRKLGDFGHKFPARLVRKFVRGSDAVRSGLRSSLKCRRRFWSLDHLSDEVQAILGATPANLETPRNDEYRLEEAIRDAVDESNFSGRVSQAVHDRFGGREWETVIRTILERRYPGARVQNTSGQRERDHGTDILVRIPGMAPGQEYAIAVQVKDHRDQVGDAAIGQIEKAEYWSNEEGLTLIDRVVVFTGAKKEGHSSLAETAAAKGVSLVFREDLDPMLAEYAASRIDLSMLE